MEHWYPGDLGQCVGEATSCGSIFFSFSRDFENLFLREFLTLLASSVWEKSTLIPELRHRAKVLTRACLSTQASVAMWILAGGLGAVAQNLLPFLEPCSIIRFPVDSLVFLHSQIFFLAPSLFLKITFSQVLLFFKKAVKSS